MVLASHAFANVQSFLLAIHASSIEVFCAPQLDQQEEGLNVHAMLIVMQYTLSTGIKQKKLQHMQDMRVVARRRDFRWFPGDLGSLHTVSSGDNSNGVLPSTALKSGESMIVVAQFAHLLIHSHCKQTEKFNH